MSDDRCICCRSTEYQTDEEWLCLYCRTCPGCGERGGICPIDRCIKPAGRPMTTTTTPAVVRKLPRKRRGKCSGCSGPIDYGVYRDGWLVWSGCAMCANKRKGGWGER